MTPLAAAGPGVILVLVIWAAWYLLDPPLRPEGISWPRLVAWLLAPVGLYLFLAQHREPPSTMGSLVGKEGTIASLDPLEVEVVGSFWHARLKSGQGLRLGERVRVVERAGLTLTVDRISAAPAPASPTGEGAKPTGSMRDGRADCGSRSSG